MKNIHLSFNEDFFFKMKAHKQKKEREAGQLITWENYIKLLFGFRNRDKEVK